MMTLENFRFLNCRRSFNETTGIQSEVRIIDLLLVVAFLYTIADYTSTVHEARAFTKLRSN